MYVAPILFWESAFIFRLFREDRSLRDWVRVGHSFRL
jgi:hypothetical protein